jgi:hypothetical protein
LIPMIGWQCRKSKATNCGTRLGRWDDLHA